MGYQYQSLSNISDIYPSTIMVSKRQPSSNDITPKVCHDQNVRNSVSTITPRKVRKIKRRLSVKSRLKKINQQLEKQRKLFKRKADARLEEIADSIRNQRQPSESVTPLPKTKAFAAKIPPSPCDDTSSSPELLETSLRSLNGLTASVEPDQVVTPYATKVTREVISENCTLLTVTVSCMIKTK